MSLQAKSNYYKGYDGLRFFAILAIIFYHYVPYRLPGGFLGVDIFLILSGFLLGQTFRKTDKVPFSYGAYLKKRFIRLTIPLLGLFLFSIAFFTVFAPQFLFNLKATFFSSLVYLNNYVQILSGSSYFQAFVNPSPFVHLWYLGVQMQLYVLAPILFMLAKLIFKKQTRVAGFFFVLAIGSAVLMGVLLPIGGDPSRVYYGTDTRAFSFFIGIGASLILPKVASLLRKRQARGLIVILTALVSLGLMIYFMFALEAMMTITYRGGIFVFDILVALFLMSLTLLPLLDKTIGFLPFAILGKFSFSVYLWYYPIYSFFSYGDFATSWLGKYWLVQVIFLFILGGLSYFIFEVFFSNLIQSGKWRASLKQFSPERLRANQKKMIATILVLMISLTSVIGLLLSPSGKNETVAELEARIAENQRKIAEAKLKERLEAGKELPNIEGLDRAVMLFAHQQKLTFIGDSILLSGAAAVANVFPNSHIDGAVGRQLYNSASVVQNLLAKGKLADTVIVVLGTNGNFTEKQLKQFVDSFGKDRQLVFLNTYVARSWQDNVNASLSKLAKENKNIILFNWYDYVKGHTDWFAPDKVHLNEKGAKEFANFIAKNYYDNFDQTHKSLEQAKMREQDANKALENSKVVVGSVNTESSKEN